MSARCEDYPCCGHEDGGCPDSSGRFPCSNCGKRLPKDSRSSICNKCQRRMERQARSGADDHDYSMNW